MRNEKPRPTGEEALVILEQLQAEGHISEALIQEKLTAVRGGIHDETHSQVEAAVQGQEKHELEPAQVERLVGQFKANFTNNNRELPKLHPDVKWTEVEASLREQPELMWSLSKMEETGGKVDVIEEDAGTFLFGDTSRESPEHRRNVVFDKEAEPYATAGIFNGNAADKVKEWRVDFMNEEQYRALQERGNFDAKTWSWLKTPSEVRRAGYALRGHRGSGSVYVNQRHADPRDVSWGFRCALRVPKKA